MKTFEQIQRLIIDCILAGMATEVSIRSHVNALGVSPTEVLDALEELERKIWIVREPGPICDRWRVMPIAKAALRRMAAVEVGVEVIEATASNTGLKAVCRDIGGNYTVMRSKETVMVFRDKGVK